MSDIKLFRTSGDGVTELTGEGFPLEKKLQNLIEAHLETFLGVRFLASEYGTGTRHGGRIDTLGLDENGCPVIIEYKRDSKENIINQGLFYLSWLLDHKAEFQLLVMKQLGPEVAELIEWASCRLLCIAGDFTRYDEHAVEQINRNIELIRYRRFGNDLLLFELVNAPSGSAAPSPAPTKTSARSKTFIEALHAADPDLTELYESLRIFLLGLGDDVQERQLKLYAAFRRLRNFACVEIHTKSRTVVVFLKVDPDTVDLDGPLQLRDVRTIGHFGTGDLELRLQSHDDLRRAEPLLERSYENS
ncbi:MAG: DUF5655 domain-containing protein [Acidobacteriota bacterium]